MRGKKLAIRLRAALTAFTILIFLASSNLAFGQYRVLHGFGSRQDGKDPTALRYEGYFFGVTTDGGTYGQGTVYQSYFFEGQWVTTEVYSFGMDPALGTYPSSGLIRDERGNLYGSTSEGGQYGYGVVWQLANDGSGGYSYAVLWSLMGPPDGADPLSGLIFDHDDNLIGTSFSGGANGVGAVFKLAYPSWTESVIYSFSESNGSLPAAGLIIDPAGNLFGTTESGGSFLEGTVYELSPNGSGGYTETVLHSFGNGTDGFSPVASLVEDSAGNLYGTTFLGGTNSCGGTGCGTVFKLSPGQGGYTETVLHDFGANGNDGTEPAAGLLLDSAGNL